MSQTTVDADLLSLDAALERSLTRLGSLLRRTTDELVGEKRVVTFATPTPPDGTSPATSPVSPRRQPTTLGVRSPTMARRSTSGTGGEDSSDDSVDDGDGIGPRNRRKKTLRSVSSDCDGPEDLVDGVPQVEHALTTTSTKFYELAIPLHTISEEHMNELCADDCFFPPVSADRFAPPAWEPPTPPNYTNTTQITAETIALSRRGTLLSQFGSDLDVSVDQMSTMFTGFLTPVSNVTASWASSPAFAQLGKNPNQQLWSVLTGSHLCCYTAPIEQTGRCTVPLTPKMSCSQTEILNQTPTPSARAADKNQLSPVAKNRRSHPLAPPQLMQTSSPQATQSSSPRLTHRSSPQLSHRNSPPARTNSKTPRTPTFPSRHRPTKPTQTPVSRLPLQHSDHQPSSPNTKAQATPPHTPGGTTIANSSTNGTPVESNPPTPTRSETATTGFCTFSATSQFHPVLCICVAQCTVSASTSNECDFELREGAYVCSFRTSSLQERDEWISRLITCRMITHASLVHLAWFNTHAHTLLPQPHQEQVQESVRHSSYTTVCSEQYLTNTTQNGGCESFVTVRICCSEIHQRSRHNHNHSHSHKLHHQHSGDSSQLSCATDRSDVSTNSSLAWVGLQSGRSRRSVGGVGGESTARQPQRGATVPLTQSMHSPLSRNRHYQQQQSPQSQKRQQQQQQQQSCTNAVTGSDCCCDGCFRGAMYVMIRDSMLLFWRTEDVMRPWGSYHPTMVVDLSERCVTVDAVCCCGEEHEPPTNRSNNPNQPTTSLHKISIGATCAQLVLYFVSHLTFRKWEESIAIARCVHSVSIYTALLTQEEILLHTRSQPPLVDAQGGYVGPLCVLPHDSHGLPVLRHPRGHLINSNNNTWLCSFPPLFSAPTTNANANASTTTSSSATTSTNVSGTGGNASHKNNGNVVDGDGLGLGGGGGGGGEALDAFWRPLPKTAVRMFADNPVEPIGVGVDGVHYALPSGRAFVPNDIRFDDNGFPVPRVKVMAAHTILPALKSSFFLAGCVGPSRGLGLFDPFGRVLTRDITGKLRTVEGSPYGPDAPVFNSFGKQIPRPPVNTSHRILQILQSTPSIVPSTTTAPNGSPSATDNTNSTTSTLTPTATPTTRTAPHTQCIGTVSIITQHTTLAHVQSAVVTHLSLSIPACSVTVLRDHGQVVASAAEAKQWFASDCLPAVWVRVRDCRGRLVVLAQEKAKFALEVDHTDLDVQDSMLAAKQFARTAKEFFQQFKPVGQVRK